eukprot:m.49751 g.49751  ORF g.49751 m.49751 type:complete len:541 (+) comp8979_c0_seq1:2527-4149(+)
MIHLVRGRPAPAIRRHSDPARKIKMAFSASADFGVVWPTDSSGKVSTTETGKRVWMAAAGAENPLATAIAEEKKWRWRYPDHLVSLAEQACQTPKSALDIATRGLQALHDEFEYVHPNGTRVKLREVENGPQAGVPPLYTTILEGRMSPKDGPDMLYDQRRIREERLVAKLKQWVDYGVAEEMVYRAIASMNKLGHEDFEALTEKFVFVLLGATSEMGPVSTLLNMGFTVVCVARNGRKLNALMRRMDKLAGELVVPLNKPQRECQDNDELFEAAGADILTQTPELIDWISGLFPDSTMVVDSLAYLDGEAGVRVCVAMDAIAAGVLKRRKEGTTALAYLLSPATAYPTDAESYEKRVQRYENRGWSASLLWLSPNHREPVECTTDGGILIRMPVLNGFITEQGPNYALAKTLQQWRAIVERSRGVRVSANFAPGCRTESVMHSKTVAAAIEGSSYFDPNMAFNPETASSVLTWLMMYDLTNPTSPSNPDVDLEHPFCLFWHAAFHGGGWNCAYSAQSLGMPAYVLGRLGYRKRLDEEAE